MHNNFKIKQGILALIILALFSMPITVSAQSFWDVFSSEYWYSFVADGSADPNDDKKKKDPPTTVPPPQVPDLPAGEYCRNELGELVPCPVNK